MKLIFLLTIFTHLRSSNTKVKITDTLEKSNNSTSIKLVFHSFEINDQTISNVYLGPESSIKSQWMSS